MKKILILAALAVACADDNSTTKTDEKQPQTQQPRVVPNYVTVEHILIAVANPRMPKIKRTHQEAEQLVEDIRAQLDDGADFEKLKQQHSDDRGPTGRANGPYDMANRGMNPGKAIPRERMVPGFGDTSFALEVDEVGVAEFDAVKSPYGYHIVKRVK